MAETFLNLAEVLRLTGFHSQTLHLLVDAGVFPPPDDAGLIWRASEILDWFKRCEEEPEHH